MLAKTAKYASYLTAIGAVLAIGWTFGDTYGFRPALKIEVNKVLAQVEQVSSNVLWNTWFRLENQRKHGGLSPQDCAIYRRLSQQLGVPPGPC